VLVLVLRVGGDNAGACLRRVCDVPATCLRRVRMQPAYINNVVGLANHIFGLGYPSLHHLRPPIPADLRAVVGFAAVGRGVATEVVRARGRVLEVVVQGISAWSSATEVVP
jgi:hypothetical protein